MPRRTSSSKRGANPNCSSVGGFRSRWACRCSRADMDVRTGGAYRFVFSHPAFDQPMAFFGTYREVTPNKRLVWTNEESDQGAVTTVTFEENAGKTLVTLHELYPTTAALDEALAGSAEGLPEQFAQLEELRAGRS